jgi:hypothetical protein
MIIGINGINQFPTSAFYSKNCLDFLEIVKLK